jgi:hypothetical protein
VFLEPVAEQLPLRLISELGGEKRAEPVGTEAEDGPQL